MYQVVSVYGSRETYTAVVLSSCSYHTSGDFAADIANRKICIVQDERADQLAENVDFG